MKEIYKWLSGFVCDFPEFSSPWEIIDYLKNNKLSTNLNKREVSGLEGAEVYCGKNVEIQPYALFSGQVFIGNNTRIGPYSFLRGPIIIGNDCLVGPYSEIFRIIVQDGSTLSHKNLIGDSVVGRNVTCAGNTTVCNVPFGRNFIKARYYDLEEKVYGKYGATIGDDSKIGALTTIMPGAHILPNSTIVGQCVVHGKNKVKSMIR